MYAVMYTYLYYVYIHMYIAVPSITCMHNKCAYCGFIQTVGDPKKLENVYSLILMHNGMAVPHKLHPPTRTKKSCMNPLIPPYLLCMLYVFANLSHDHQSVIQFLLSFLPFLALFLFLAPSPFLFPFLFLSLFPSLLFLPLPPSPCHHYH